MKRSDLSDYAMHRLNQRDADKEKLRQERIDHIKSIAWVLADVLAWVVLFITLASASMLDSVSFVPAIVFGVSVVCLTVYGAFRGVLR